MDLKSKLRTLVGKQELRSADLSPSDSMDNLNDFAFIPTNTIQPIDRGRGSSAPDPQVDAQVYESIEASYFLDNDSDSSDRELQLLNGDYDLSKIDHRRKFLKNQLEVVTKKLSEVILHKQVAYTEELKRVTEIEKTLEIAEATTKIARAATQKSHNSFAAKELRLLQFYNRGQHKLVLLRALTEIKTLQRTIAKIVDYIDDENYGEAIHMTLSCRQAAKLYRQYSCVGQLLANLQDTLTLIEQRLDAALGKICLYFDSRLYSKVYHAFQLLDKNQTAVDQLHMHFITTIHNRCFGIVLGFAEMTQKKTGRQTENLNKKPYQELCQGVGLEYFVATLLALTKGLWDIMKTYRSLVQWHLDAQQADRHRLASGDAVAGSDLLQENSREKDVVEVYVLHKLESGPPRLWSDMEQKIRALLLNNDSASHLKYDSFGHMLSILKRFCAVGKEFGNANSDALMDAVKQQASKFFTLYHRSKLEELHFFIDNECWEVCPMKTRFSCFDLWEFQFLRSKSCSFQNGLEQIKILGGRGDDSCFFVDFSDQGTPFDDLIRDEEHSEDVLIDREGSDHCSSESDEDVLDELKQEEIDETGDRISRHPKQRRSSAFKSIISGGPVVTNSTLTVLRLFGRYLFFMTMLESIASEAVNSLSQYFDYYLFTVFSIFSTEIHEYFEPMLITKRLYAGIKRIQDNLICLNSDHVEFLSDGKVRIPSPSLSARIDLKDPKTFFGLPERIAAMESLAFLASQMEQIRPLLEKALPAQRRVFLQQFYTQSVSLVADVRPVVYWNVAYRTINYDKALTMMADVAWDIKDLASQHSAYVEHLVKELENLGHMITTAKKTTAVPKDAADALWTLAVLLANRTFVEGFSGAKKCTNEGRALMQLDYQQFVVKAEKLSSLRPIPDREFTDAYIKAFYLSEDALEKWIKEHKEYTLKHMLGLIEQSPSLSKKTKHRLQQFVEDPIARSIRK